VYEVSSAEPAAPSDVPLGEENPLYVQPVDDGLLHMITQISSGVANVTKDSFERSLPDVPGAVDGLDAFRIACRSASRLVTTFAATQESRLEAAAAGRLIRTVLHADGGAIFCYSIVPGQYLVGLVFLTPEERTKHTDTPLNKLRAVNTADHTMTSLTDTLRNRLGLPPQDAGGWTTEDQQPLFLAGTQDLLQAAVGETDLHYVARVHAQRLVATADRFDDETLRPFFELVSRSARRKLYGDLATDMFNTVGQVSRLMRSTVSGVLSRAVLDVEQGAVFYYRLGVGDYLVGVTLNQKQVAASDNKMAALAQRLMDSG
jgi:hypothetical protein